MHRTHRGFSLVELIATTSIAVLLLGLALPPFMAVLDRQAAAAEHNRLAAGLHAARSLALTYNHDTVVCPVDDHGQCRNDGVWDLGWKTWGDLNRNLRLDPGEPVHRQETRDSGNVLIRSSASRPRVVFRRNGMTRGSNLTIRLCDPAGKALTAIVINNHGRARKATRGEVDGGMRCE